MTPGAERLEADVRGRVQGVGFRYFVLSRALDLELTGWTSNSPDGSVRCVAEGPRASLERLLAALEEGPPGALVDGVVTRWLPATGAFVTFEVRSGAHRGD